MDNSGAAEIRTQPRSECSTITMLRNEHSLRTSENYRNHIRRNGSLVGIATNYGKDDRGVGSSNPGRVKNIHYYIPSRPALDSTQPPIQGVEGALSPWVKRPGREAGHLPPTSAEFKETSMYTSTQPYVFMA
jgi:hypothetical protein